MLRPFMLEAPDSAHTGMLLERCASSSPQENITKKSNELHNYFILKILIEQAIPP